MVDEIIDTPQTPEAAEPAQPQVKAPPIESRFLFVDIAALRAKQLRRGARPRIAGLAEGDTPTPDHPRKPERVTMEEVRQGLVSYEVPELHPAGEEQ